MANVQLNIGDKLSFDANDSPAGSQNTTYFKCPSANPDNAIQAYVANVQTAKFGQGLLEVFAAGSGAGDVVVDGNFKYADSGGRTIQKVIHCMNFVNVAESTSTADLIYYESPGSTPPYYIRMKDLAAPRAQGVVPISLPQGATITGFDMQFRKVQHAGELDAVAELGGVYRHHEHWKPAGSHERQRFDGACHKNPDRAEPRRRQ